ncbi:ABC transporter permease [Schlesneria paludicola]|uniref:ABC transporter permease n=1 Tax=Schlesneria paludicola TaxID=360056 RepID=UPI00029AD67C|nr:hypothetical protein [Schlesneria paludicola]
MFAVPVGRILWKEYRAQRTLWLACAGLGCLIEILIACFVGNEKTMIMSGVPGILAMCYGAACSAVLFAGEREERTSDWLLNLSVPPAALVVGKFGFAILSTIALQLVIAIPCVVMRPAGITPQHLQTFFVPFGLLGLVWMLLGSLTSRRVLVSIGAMAMWWIVTFLPIMALSSNFFFQDSSNQRTQAIGIFVVDFLFFAIFVVDVGVTWRWSQGRYWDGSIVDRLQQWCAERLKALPGRRWKARPLIGRIENEQSWRRTWQRLIWHERHRESLHLLLLAVGCLAGLTIPVDGLLSFTHRAHLVWLGMLALPMAMGVLAFEPSRAKPQGSFLINRGVSPGVVWLAKNVVWLARAFWIPGIIFVVGYWCERSADPLLGGGSSQGTHPLQELYQRMMTRPDLAVCYVLLCYGCGQLAATLVQSAILAGAFGVVLNLIAASWLLSTDWLELPLWWFWGIPILACPLISFWQMRPRMLDDQSWIRHGTLAAAVVAVPLVLLISLSVYRVHEVQVLPHVDSTMRIQSGILSRELIAASRPSPDDIAFRDRVVQILQSRGDDRVFADQLVVLLNGEPNVLRIPFKTSSASYESTITALRSAILVRANEQMRAGERDKSLESLLATLKLARLLAKDQVFYGSWTKWSGSQFDVLDALVNWANCPFQTPASIREGMKLTEAELTLFPTATEAIMASYQHDREVTDATSIGQINDYVMDSTHLIPLTAPDLIGILYFPWERVRMKTLMELEAEFLFAGAWGLETQLKDLSSHAASQPDVQSVHPYQNQRQMFAAAYAVRDRNRKMILQRATEIRAALLRIELIAYRLEHQTLPTELVELLETANSLNIVDPWSNRAFEYYPTMILSKGGRGTALVPVSATHVQFKNEDNSDMIPGMPPLTPQQVLEPSAIERLVPSPEAHTRKLEWIRPLRALFLIPEQIKVPVEP